MADLTGVAEAKAIIDRGRRGFPLVVDREEPHRLWAAALFCRMLDGYEAVLHLHDLRLDAEASAHSRIAFEHLLAFAWVVAKPTDAQRPLRIARYGAVRLAKQRPLDVGQDDRGGQPGPMAVVGEALEPPPATEEMCRVLDGELTPRIRDFEAGTTSSFSGWYAYLYREGSGFVHPSPAGLEPYVELSAAGLVIGPRRSAPNGLVGATLTQLIAAERVARIAAPWIFVTGD